MDCRGRGRETNYEATAVIQVREDGSSGKDVRGKADSGYISKAWSGFANRLEVECERKESEDDHTVCGFSIHENRETWKE